MSERNEQPRCGRKASQSFSIDSILHKQNQRRRHGKTSDGESSSSPTPPSSPLLPLPIVTTFPYGLPPASTAGRGIMVAVPQTPFLSPAGVPYPIIFSSSPHCHYYTRQICGVPTSTNQCAVSPAKVRHVTVGLSSTSDVDESDGDDSLAEEKTSDAHNSTEEQSCEFSPGGKRMDGFRKKKRTAFTTRQLQELETKFTEQKYLTKSDRMRLAKHLGLTEKHVKTWYQNRRTKWKRGTTEAEWSRERENSAAVMYHQFITEKNRLPPMAYTM